MTTEETEELFNKACNILKEVCRRYVHDIDMRDCIAQAEELLEQQLRLEMFSGVKG